MKYDFDQVVDRAGTDSFKWDCCERVFGAPDVLPLWVADMDFLCPPPVVEAIKERAAHGVYGYTMTPPSAYEAVVAWLRARFGWEIQREWITFIPGVVPGANFAIHACSRPGGHILIQPPVYPPFFAAIAENGRRQALNQLRLRDGHYEMDFDDLARKLSRGVEMAFLCAPHNPVGRVWREDELVRFGELCLQNEVVIVSDEIHHDLVFKGARHVPLASLSDALAQRTITLVAPSKTFNLAGLSASAAIIPNPRLRRQFGQAIEQAGIHFINLFGGVGLEAGYRYGADWLDQLLEYLQGNLNYMLEYFASEAPAIKPIKPEGTYMAWLDCRDLGLDGPALKRFMIEQARVGLNDGPTFGPGGEGFQRINMACPRSILAEALDRIRDAVNRL
jgi:cysteine-S-conjugate beta-lyase